MKSNGLVRFGLGLGVVAMLLVTGCAGSASSAEPGDAGITPGSPAVVASATAVVGDSLVLTEALPEGYDGALSARNQLMLGSLRLAEGAQAVTPEQAQELVFYWQALKALGTSSTSASEESAALQVQILEAMTPEQVAEIAAMRLTNDDLDAFYTAQGVVFPTPEPGVTPQGQGQGGRNSGLSPEEREAVKATAAAQGTPTGAGGGSGAARRDVLLDSLIAYLEARAQE